MHIVGCRVMITGGAGFIGSHVVDRLLAGDNEVLVIDDFSSGQWRNLTPHLGHPKLRVEEVDILDAQAMMELCKGAEYVFHLATRNVRLSLRQPTIVHDVNTTGTLNVLKAAAAARVKRFLYCSSSEVNGTADRVPMPEDYHYHPETMYGASKLAGEYYTQVFHRSGWLPTVIARPHNTYGPREHYDGFKGEVIPRFILWALAGRPLVIYGDGRQTRDFTYVTETADFLIRLMAHEGTVGQTFNICRGQEVSIRELARMISELTDLQLPPHFIASRPHDVLRLYGDVTKLRQTLGEAPRISVREGLTRTIGWFRQHIRITDVVLESLQQECWEQLAAEPWQAVLHVPPVDI